MKKECANGIRLSLRSQLAHLHIILIYSNLYLNFLILTVISTVAINNKIPISLYTNTTGTPSIINFRTA